MTEEQTHLLVLGAGSVGRRHMQNLKQLGCRVSAMDPRADRLEDANWEVGIEKRFTAMEEVSAHWQEFDGVVVGSPPSFHIDQAIAALEQDKPVLMEKPLCRTLDGATRLQQCLAEHPDRKLLLGYTYRWWQPLLEFRQRLLNGDIGKVLHVRFVMSAHLADWHPWERYQDFFMASREQGGGALLDESHFIDLMYWFFGMPETIAARVEKLSDLEISTDDNVDIIATYADGLRVTIHLDLYGRPHEKFIRAGGENRSMEWSFDPNRIRYSEEMSEGWDEQLFEGERNDMFIDVAQEFIDMIRHGVEPSCGIADGVNVMRLIEACRQSSDNGRTIKISSA